MTVRFYLSTFGGRASGTAPNNLNNVAGKLIGVLDACLISGISLPTISSITRSGSTATVTCTAHGLFSLARITISGAVQSEYNGEFPVTVVDANTFTYTVSGTPTTPATGTPTGAVTPSGWTKEFSGTNKAVYRAPSGNRFYLRVDDTGANDARVVAYETMSSVDAGTGDFPTAAQIAGGLYWQKSSSSTVRDWQLVVSSTALYIFTNDGGGDNTRSCNGFGDFTSFKAGDVYNTFLIGATSSGTNTSGGLFGLNSNVSSLGAGHYCPRDYTQTGTSIQIGKHTLSAVIANASVMGSAGLTYPHPVSGGLVYAKAFIHEASPTGTRGYVNGLIVPLHTTPFAQLDTLTVNSKTYLTIKGGWFGEALIEISNGW